MAKSAKPSWNPDASPTENAKRYLPALVSEYFAKGRKLMDGKPTADALHRLRLATKHLRYTLELFRPCYGKTIEKRLDRLRGVQSRLGEINDCASTLTLIRPAAKNKELVAFLRKRGADRTQAFRQHWQQVFDTPGQERLWKQYLTQFGRAEAGPRAKRK
jgi:CHAD domain-containing protein